MDFSVVVPFFNAEKFIEQCCRALLNQTIAADRYEILMVDNNSHDSSASIVGRFDRVKLLQEPEQGSYAARNRALSHASGQIIAFTDPDCAPRRDWLEQIGRALNPPDAALILGDRRFASDEGVLGMLAGYESEMVARIFEQQQTDCYYAYTNNMAVRASLVNRIGGFEKLARGADTLFLRRVAEVAGPSALRHDRAVVVRHLEIASVHDYLQKKATYGDVRSRMRDVAPHSLPFGTRCKLAIEAIRRHGSLPKGIAFFGVLAMGAIEFEWCAARKRAVR